MREDLSLSPDDSVMVSEMAGTDLRCSSVVTEVKVEGPAIEAYSFHIEHPLAGLTRMDLIAALAFGGGH